MPMPEMPATVDPDLAPMPVRPGSSTYHLDCTGGNDNNSGLGPAQAWRTLSRLTNLSARPGDRILLKRGCVWQGPFRINWSGSAEWPIVISSYGQSELPGIRDSSSNHVDIFGSYLVIEHIRAFTSPGQVPVDRNCQNQPFGWRTGFTLQGQARYVTIRHSEAYGNTAGVHITRTASHNRIIYNHLHDNILMSVNTNDGGYDDSGAWGIVLNGTDNEIGHNRFSGNNAWCSYDFGQEGASIEVYEAARNYIHHNISINDTTFTELGSSSFRQANDNIYAYNVYSSNLPSEFLVTRGKDSPFGPVSGTKVFNNTVHLTHPENTQGVVCYGGCSSQILELRNNIMWVQWKALYADAPFAESNNIYWRSGGNPLMQFFGGSQMSSTSRVANPMFVNPANHNFKLQSGSPAIDAGVSTSLGITQDVEGIAVPQNGRVDIGAHEYKR
jgi:hypothetical protein